MGRNQLKRELKQIFSVDKLSQMSNGMEDMLSDSKTDEIKEQVDAKKCEYESRISYLKNKFNKLLNREYITIAGLSVLIFDLLISAFTMNTSILMNGQTAFGLISTTALLNVGAITAGYAMDKKKPKKLAIMDFEIYKLEKMNEKTKELSKKVDSVVESREIVKEILKATNEVIHEDENRRTVTLTNKENRKDKVDIRFTDAGEVENIEFDKVSVKLLKNKKGE